MKENSSIIVSDDGEPTEFEVYEEGVKSAFKCICGCKTFYKYSNFPTRYHCSVCDAVYTSE